MERRRLRAATWPAGPARSFSSSPPAAVQGPSAEELAAAAAASTAAKARLASLGIARSAPPAMPREARSGSPYSSPGRATAASSAALGTGTGLAGVGGEPVLVFPRRRGRDAANKLRIHRYGTYIRTAAAASRAPRPGSIDALPLRRDSAGASTASIKPADPIPYVNADSASAHGLLDAARSTTIHVVQHHAHVHGVVPRKTERRRPRRRIHLEPSGRP